MKANHNAARVVKLELLGSKKEQPQAQPAITGTTVAPVAVAEEHEGDLPF